MAEGSGGGRGGFTTNIGFVLAAAGSAVGLGNIWKFPYIAGENGGGIFVFFYLLCIVAIGLPVMIADDALTTIVLGSGRALDEINLLRQVALHS